MNVLRKWFNRQFSDPQVVILAVLLLIGFVSIKYFGKMLTPLFMALIGAYFMEGLVQKLQKLKIPRLPAVTVVVLFFLVVGILILVGLLPRLFQQVERFVVDLPSNVEKLQVKMEEVKEAHPDLFIKREAEPKIARPPSLNEYTPVMGWPSPGGVPASESGTVLVLPEHQLKALVEMLAPLVRQQLQPSGATPESAAVPHEDVNTNSVKTATASDVTAPEVLPDTGPVEKDTKIISGFISEEVIDDLINQIGIRITRYFGNVVTWSLAAGTGLVIILVYLILVPLLVFFFLKDKDKIVAWVGSFLPEERGLAAQVWKDVDQQIGNYVRGKVLEILIVWSVTYVTFSLFGLQYTMLLSLFVGLSVLIPYIGATVMTIPVALIAFFQFGVSSELTWIVIAYLIIQALDGNVLAPLLFSEVTDLHPIAVIMAVLFFGGIWGFWGVFFAIPLATLVNAVIKAWPKGKEETAPGGS